VHRDECFLSAQIDKVYHELKLILPKKARASRLQLAEIRMHKHRAWHIFRLITFYMSNEL